MSATVTLPLQPERTFEGWRLAVLRAATIVIVVYAIVYPWFTAPSRFLRDRSYAAQVQGSPLHLDMIALELPASDADLAKTLLATEKRQHPAWHEAQLNQYRVAQAWDNVFIELYVIQFISVVLLVAPYRRAWIVFAQGAASGAMLVAGYFDWKENLRIDQILRLGEPPFGDLIRQVNVVSEIKWAAFSLASLLLAVAILQLADASRRMRVILSVVLGTAGVCGVIGCIPGIHWMLSASVGFYSLMPILIFWNFVVHPAIYRADGWARALEQRTMLESMSRIRERGIERPAAEPPKWSLKDLDK